MTLALTLGLATMVMATASFETALTATQRRDVRKQSRVACDHESNEPTGALHTFRVGAGNGKAQVFHTTKP